MPPFVPCDLPRRSWLQGGLFGQLAELRGDPLGTMTSWQREHGDFVRFRVGRRQFALVSHPALALEVLQEKADVFEKIYDPKRPTGLALVLGTGLLTATGEGWRQRRRIIQPIFHRSRLPQMLPQILQAGQRLEDRWGRQAVDDHRDLCAEMMQVTLEAITQTMFSTSVLAHIEHIGPALEICLRYAFHAFHNPLRPPLWVPTPTNRTFRRAKAVLTGLMDELIAARRQHCEQGGQRHGDLLDLLLEARDPVTGTGLSDQQLRDEMLTIAAAGHETTANAVTWAWFLLGQHPDAVRRLQAELDEALAGRTPELEDLPRLPFTHAVFEEAMRLYPPVPAIQRRALEATTLGEAAVTPGTIVIVAIRNVHRHPAWWEEPDRFQPERWLQRHEMDISRAPRRLAYLPFGAGPRMCVGSTFAMLEGPLLLALIAQRYDLELVPGEVVPRAMVTLRPRDGLPVRVRRREHANRGEHASRALE